MQIRNQRDFWAGIMFIAIGSGFMILSGQYQVGTAAKMGPGYFPLVLGGLLTLLGILISLTGLSKGGPKVKIDPFGWKELILVLVSVAVFASLLTTMGVVVSLIAMIIIASFASHEFTWKSTILTAIVLCVLAWAIFVYGLELQFPVWPVFLTK